MLLLSYSVIALDRKTKDVHGEVQFNINCSFFVIAIEVCKVSKSVPRLTMLKSKAPMSQLVNMSALKKASAHLQTLPSNWRFAPF